MKIGIFDSGIGGLTVLKELLSAIPSADYVYLGDTARTPYGTKCQDTVIRYSIQCADFLLSNKIDLLVVACNTASSLALDALKAHINLPVFGTIESACGLALQHSDKKNIAVIGTEATVKSGAYSRNLHSTSNKVSVFEKACPLFVPLVEQGMFEGEIVDKIIALYLEEIKELSVDTLILGCTHYPLLKRSITSYLGNGVAVVECSKALAGEVQVSYPLNNSVNHSGQRSFYVTDGVDRFKHLAGIFLNRRDIEVNLVEL